MKTTLVFTLIFFTVSLFIFFPHTIAVDTTEWNLPEGAITRLGKGHISDIKYSPDGMHLAVAGNVGVWIYDAQTGEELNLHAGEDIGAVNSISFNSDGQLLAIGSHHGNIHIWDANIGRYRYVDRHGRLRSISFSPDGQMLASGGGQNLFLWNAQTGERIYPGFVGHTGWINSVSFSPDGQTLASAAEDNTIRLWSVQTKELLHTITEHTDKVQSVSFSPDGQTLASASEDNTVRLWNAKTGELLHTHRRHTWAYSVAFSPDGQILASGVSGNITLWDVRTGDTLHGLRSSGDAAVSFSPDGKTIASGGSDGSLRLWDVKTGELISRITGHTGAVQSVAFSPDGEIFANTDYQRNVRLWNTQTGEILHTLTGSNISFSPDSQMLASLQNNAVDLRDVKTGDLLYTLTKQGIYNDVSFSPNGEMLATGSSDGNVPIWDVKTRTLRHTLIGHPRDVKSVAFSPDSQLLASCGRDVRIWDTKIGKLLHTFTEHRGTVWDVSFSPDGKTLAVGGVGGVRLWDAETGEITRTLTESGANSVAFSPDGKTLACDRWLNTVHLWDTETGELLQEFSGHTDSIYSVAFSPDGRTLASGSADGIVLLWELAPALPETDSITETHDISDTLNIAEYTTTASLPEGAKTRIGKGTMLDMRYTPDGKYLKVTSSIGSWLYDAETHQELGMQAFPKTFIGERSSTDVTQYVVISPDGTTGARQAENRRLIHLWDVETDTPLHTITGNPNLRDHLLLFSPDGKKLVIGNGPAAYLWDVETGSLLHTFADTYHEVYYGKNYCFSSDGTILALGNNIHIRLWDVERGNLLRTFVKRVNTRSSIAFSPDGKTLATGVTEGNLGDMIHVWDVETGTFLLNINKRERTHGSGAIYSLAFSSDGRTLAGGQSDGKISLWSVGTGVFLHATAAVANSIGSHPILSLAFSPDGETLAAGVEDGTLRLWDVKTATHLDTIGYMPSNIRSIAFSPDGKTLAIGSGYGTIHLWDTESSTLLRSFRADISTVHSVVFSPDGKTLVSGGRDNHLRLWDVETGHLLQSFPPQFLPNQTINEIHNISFSPDGKTLAIVQDEFIGLLDMETDTILCQIGFPQVNISDRRVAFSPDGKTLVSGHSGHQTGILHLWDVEECSFLGIFGNCHGNRFKDITFSPSDGKRLMVLTEGGLEILNISEETSCSPRLPNHFLINHFDIPNRGVGAFSPDGKMLATGVLRLVSGGFEDSNLYVWDVNTGEPINTFEGGPVRSLVFSADSTTLASEGGDGTVLLWELTAPTEPEPESLTADVNGDGEVNIQDLVAVAATIGQTGENAADVNRDGVVNIQDLVAVAAALGADAAAPAALRQQATAELTVADVQHWLTQAQQADLTDVTSVKGIRFLEQLLAAFTPKETALLANYPNPFNPETWIPYQLAKPADVALTIYDIQGRVVRDLDLGHQRAGIYQSRARAAHWDGRNAQGESVASGVYFYTLKAGDFTATRKLLIRK